MVFWLVGFLFLPLLFSCTKKAPHENKTHNRNKEIRIVEKNEIELKPSSDLESSHPIVLTSIDEEEVDTDPEHKEEKITRKKDKKKEEGEDNRAAWTRYALERPCRRLAKQYKRKVKKFIAVGKDGKPLPANAYESKVNEMKNRYSDVICLDSTRVILKGGKSDYIHASWFTLPDNSVTYICAQGPLKETVEDFWRLIYQERTKMVIMLCQLVEGKQEKTALYWPPKKGDVEQYGEFTVTQVEQRPAPFEGVTLTYFDVQYMKEEPFRIWHVIVTWWPDQLAPSDPTLMLLLHKWVKKNNDKGLPILVHCSAGVGRTATFVGLDYTIQRIKEDFTIEMSDIIKEMRVMRPQAIQSFVQYIFLHVLVFEQFVAEGVIKRNEKLTKFMEDYARNTNKKLKKRQEDNEKDAKQTEETEMNENSDDHGIRVPTQGELDRPPLATSHKIEKQHNRFHLLIAVTGSIAVIKLKELIELLHDTCKEQLFIKIVATKSAVTLLNTQDFDIEEMIYEDRDEWSMWRGRGDQVLHIELRRWADMLLIAPLDANSMAKMALGLSDNLVTSVVRAWDFDKPLYYAPAMNTMMWEHPLTYQHRKTLKELLQFKEIPPMEKTLMCGDSGFGAMASIELIVSIVSADVRSHFAVYSK